jgi:murein DD-endopeptidase MepM/ murein hydrolase activator NlpD
MARPGGKKVGTLGLALALGLSAPAEAEIYPRIERLRSGDPLFEQMQDDIEIFYSAWASGREFPPLAIFEYELRDTDDFLSVAARTNLPQAAIATLNRLSENSFPGNLEEILLPNLPGVFVPEDPETDLEHMLANAERDPALSIPVVIRGEGGPSSFQFFPGTDFSREERTGFLNLLFRAPVSLERMTSPFGLRRSPITGRYSFHRGADFAAPFGSGVRASREGRVSDIGVHPVYGDFVLVDHGGGYETLYAHLDSVIVELNDEVNSGTLLGTVGTSGLTTGPHLHFEIRVRGEPRDPMGFLRTSL